MLEKYFHNSHTFEWKEFVCTIMFLSSDLLHHFIFVRKSKQLSFHKRNITVLTLECGVTIILCLFPGNQSNLYMMKWKQVVKLCRFTLQNVIYLTTLFIWNVLHVQLIIFTLKKIKPLVTVKGHLSNWCNEAQLVSQSPEQLGAGTAVAEWIMYLVTGKRF